MTLYEQQADILRRLPEKRRKAIFDLTRPERTHLREVDHSQILAQYASTDLGTSLKTLADISNQHIIDVTCHNDSIHHPRLFIILDFYDDLLRPGMRDPARRRGQVVDQIGLWPRILSAERPDEEPYSITFYTPHSVEGQVYRPQIDEESPVFSMGIARTRFSKKQIREDAQNYVAWKCAALGKTQAYRQIDVSSAMSYLRRSGNQTSSEITESIIAQEQGLARQAMKTLEDPNAICAILTDWYSHDMGVIRTIAAENGHDTVTMIPTQLKNYSAN